MLIIKKKPTHRLTISLVINNGEKYLAHCLDSIAQQSFSDCLVLIIDNASIDNSQSVLTSWFSEHPALKQRSRIIINKKNLGFCRAHNQAWQWSGGDYFMVLNQDVILRPNYLAELVSFMDKHIEVGATQGKILSWDFATTQDYAKDLSKPLHQQEMIDTLGLKMFKSRRVVNIGQGEVDTGQYQKNMEIFGVAGTAAIYRRQAIEAVKFQDELFDENYFMYKEDVDLAWRLRLIDSSSYYIASATAYHDRSLKEPASFLQLIKARWHWPPRLKLTSYRNHWLTIIKNDCGASFFRHIFYIGWYEFKKLGYMIIFEPVTLFKAWGQIIRLLPATRRKRKLIRSINKKVDCIKLAKWYI